MPEGHRAASVDLVHLNGQGKSGTCQTRQVINARGGREVFADPERLPHCRPPVIASIERRCC